ncbi:hypothetical protein B0T22DRAFT_476991 [Podospora appendiculata]|uniref:Mitochondrial zinc maintenance protein 1, mitochondrial n=1 Tax=Podospora appendiculata TaxID=314037 RepID=A0AAE1CGY4_9PEZI|nr:hypothetical protein B0T22DRAFT_476991 [Podospora appendiculata]
MALQAYRHLMRAAEIAFKGKSPPPRVSRLSCSDFRMLDAARSQIRHGFREKAVLASSDAQPAIQRAEEVATFLKANLVQGRKEGENSKYTNIPSAATMIQ